MTELKTIMDEIDFGCLPEHMRDGARLYIERGIDPGSFLRAVLENDLLGAITRADHINKMQLSSYHDFLVTIPMGAKGSPGKVVLWVQAGGLEGMFKQPEEVPSLAQDS